MGGRASRQKGQRGEREFANRLKHIYPDARRGLQSQSGKDICDVEATPWFIEAKWYKRIAVFRWLEKAEEDTDGRPVVIRLREDGDTRGAILLREEDFLLLLERAGGAI